MYGIANNCEDGQYVIFLDYDEKKLQGIKIILRWLQEMYKLSNFYIFESNHGYHVICFDKIPLNKFMTILTCSSCCEKFRKTPLMFGHDRWTLRLSQKEGLKPKHIYTLKSKYNEYKKSNAHIKIISNFYNIPINKSNADKSKKLTGCNYPI